MTAALLSFRTPCIQHLASCALVFFSSCSVSHTESFITPCSGAISWACQRSRSGSSQHRGHYSAVRTNNPSQVTVCCAHPVDSLAIFFAKNPSGRSGWVKTLTCRACLLSTWLYSCIFFSFPRLRLWPLAAHWAAVKRSSPQFSSQMAITMLGGRRIIASAFWKRAQ